MVDGQVLPSDDLRWEQPLRKCMSVEPGASGFMVVFWFSGTHRMSCKVILWSTLWMRYLHGGFWLSSESSYENYIQ